jgi:Transposase DDE domain
MSTPTPLYDTIHAELAATLTTAPATQLENLALVVATAAETQRGPLGALARALPLDILATSREQRLRRFLDNPRITLATHYHPLLPSSLAGLRGQTVHLLIDRVELTPRFQLLVVSAAFRRRSVPLVWQALDHAGSTSAAEQIALLEQARPVIPAAGRIVLHGDGEFRSTELFGWAAAQDWRVMLGLSTSTYLYTTATAPQEGRTIADWYGPRRTRPLYLTAVYLTEERYGPLNVVIWWTKDQKGERIRAVGTDLSGDGYTWRAGRTRMWIETLFGDCKTRGFGVQKSGLVHGARLERLLLGLALAYVLLLSVGRWVVKRGWRRQVDTGAGRRWKVSLFQIGVSWLERWRERRELPATLLQLYW